MKPAAPERYVDARELAALMGVSQSTIKRMVRAGLPSATWGMSRTRRFLPSEALKWADSRPSTVARTNRSAGAAMPGRVDPRRR
jgi:predicted DNA-binding transcriptional regulator AlpA